MTRGDSRCPPGPLSIALAADPPSDPPATASDTATWSAVDPGRRRRGLPRARDAASTQAGAASRGRKQRPDGKLAQGGTRSTGAVGFARGLHAIGLSGMKREGCTTDSRTPPVMAEGVCGGDKSDRRREGGGRSPSLVLSWRVCDSKTSANGYLRGYGRAESLLVAEPLPHQSSSIDAEGRGPRW